MEYIAIPLIIILFASLWLFVRCSKPDEIIYPNYISEEALFTTVENELFDLINQYRIDQGKGILISDAFATDLAREHSEYWFEDGGKITSHYNFPERNAMLVKAGVLNLSEIASSGFKKPAGAFIGFIKSEKHEPSLVADFDYVGIGIKGKYYTVIFIKTSQ